MVQVVVYLHQCNTIRTHQSVQFLLSFSSATFHFLYCWSLILIEAQFSTFLPAQKSADQFGVQSRNQKRLGVRWFVVSTEQRRTNNDGAEDGSVIGKVIRAGRRFRRKTLWRIELLVRAAGRCPTMLSMEEDVTSVMLWGAVLESKAIDGDQIHCIDGTVVDSSLCSAVVIDCDQIQLR